MNILIIVIIIIVCILLGIVIYKHKLLPIYHKIFRKVPENIPKITLEEKYKIEYTPIIQNLEYPTSLRIFNDTFYITCKNGKFYKINKSVNLPEKILIYDFKKITGFIDESEAGLLCVEFYTESNLTFIYFTYTVKSSDKNYSLELIVSRYILNNDKLTNEERIFSVKCPELYHHAGTIHIRNNYLYLSIGDGGPQEDPYNNAQNDDVYLGKIIKIDIKTKKVEIIAKGLRNPWSFSISSLGLFIGDVGLVTVESVYLLNNLNPKNVYNLGWNYYEGCFNEIRGIKQKNDFYQPIFRYGRKYGHAVIGGYYVEALGLYIFGDYTGIVRILQYYNNKWNLVGEKSINDSILNFGYYDNTVYMLGNKTIYKIEINSLNA